MKSPIPPPPRGETKRIVVIGGGVIGALSAFELQRAGHKVTLLEARNWGNGSSSRSAACIRAQFETPSTVRSMIYCVRYYEQWTQVVGGSASPIVQNGYLFLKDWHADMEAVRRVVALQHAAGLPEVEVLDPVAIYERFPYLETTGIQGATWCPRDGFLSPAIVYGDAIEAAAALGALTAQNAEVASVVFNGNIPVAVKTVDGREFQGDVFVNACGVWAPRISHLFAGYPLDVKARRRYLYFIDGLNGGSDGYMTADSFRSMPMIITPRGCYCRPERAAGDMLMMGWLHPAKPVRPEFRNQDVVEPGFSDDVQAYGRVVRKEIATYLPDVERMGRFSAVTTGFYEDTPDHNPLIGCDPWTSNLVHATGFSGHGLMNAPFAAAAVTHLIAAGCGLETIDLPLVGRVDVGMFAVDRVFKGGEGMVI